MYDFVIHMFLFLGALFGSFVFIAVGTFLTVVIGHEIFVIATRSTTNPDNEETNS